MKDDKTLRLDDLHNMTDEDIRRKAEAIADQILNEREATLFLPAGSFPAPIPADGRAVVGVAPYREAQAEKPVPIIDLPTSLTGINKSTYRSLVKTCREIVAREGLVANFIDLMKELNSQGLRVKTKGADDTFLPLFQQINSQMNAGMMGRERGLAAVLRKFVDAEWVTGINAWLIRQETRPVPAMRNRSFVQPVEMTLLDPTLLNLDNLFTTGVVTMEVKPEFVKEIKANGKNHWFVALFPKGTRTRKDPPNLFRQNEILALVNKGAKELPLPLENTRILRRVDNDSDPYPVPYLIRVVDSLNDKRLLRNMNRSMLIKVINLILHIRVGSGIKDRPAGQDQLLQTRQGIELQASNDAARTQVMVTGDNVEAGWVAVPSDAIFSKEHYTVANFEFFAALLGVIASQLLSQTGQIDQQMVIKTLYGKNEQTLQRFQNFIEDIYDNLVLLANPSIGRRLPIGSVTVKPKRISIWETDAFKAMITAGVKMGCLPARVFNEEVNEDWESSVEQLKVEEELRQKFGILFGFPAYRQVSGDVGEPANSPDNKDVKSTPSKGKPEGQPQEPNRDDDGA